jgi:hypothetical protein
MIESPVKAIETHKVGSEVAGDLVGEAKVG